MALYVYAIVSPDSGVDARFRRGVAEERPRLVARGRLGAIVGGVAAVPAPSDAAVRKHDAIVRHASRRWTATLPVRFGTVVEDERALWKLLASRSSALRRRLERVRGRVQMTVRIFGAATASTAARQDDGRRPDDRPGTTYLKRASADEVRARALPQFDPVRVALRGIVHEERVAPHASPPLVASVFHLIDRSRAAAYRRRAEAAAAGASFRATISGPFPPYAFGPEDL
jgi:gas vesicle protein GvpL/GvpF